MEIRKKIEILRQIMHRTRFFFRAISGALFFADLTLKTYYEGMFSNLQNHQSNMYFWDFVA